MFFHFSAPVLHCSMDWGKMAGGELTSIENVCILYAMEEICRYYR